MYVARNFPMTFSSREGFRLQPAGATQNEHNKWSRMCVCVCLSFPVALLPSASPATTQKGPSRNGLCEWIWPEMANEPSEAQKDKYGTEPASFCAGARALPLNVSVTKRCLFISQPNPRCRLLPPWGVPGSLNESVERLNWVIRAAV